MADKVYSIHQTWLIKRTIAHSRLVLKIYQVTIVIIFFSHILHEQVASLRVFQVLGLIFILFGVVGKVGAIFVTIPYSVVGGMQIINFGVLIGVMLSNLQFIDLQSKRNLAIIGISMLVAMMMPHWIQTTPKAINTGKSGPSYFGECNVTVMPHSIQIT